MSINPTAIKAVIVNSFEQLKCVFNTFDKLEHSSTLFEQYFWAETWYNHYWQPNWQLNSIVYYYNNTIVGFAPFYVNSSVNFPYVKTLNFIGQGEPETAEVASEYLDIQIVPGYEEALYPLIVTQLNAMAFDTLNANAVLASSHLAKLVVQLNGELSQRNYCRYILNCQHWSFEQLSKNTRSRIKRTKNQLVQYNYSIRWLSEAEIYKLWPTLVKFHQTRWKNKGNSGAFNSNLFNLFHQSLIKDHAQNVTFCALFINDQPVAINYYLVDNTTLYFYQSGWDQENYAKLSPGLFLHYWAIEHCSVQQYDFMMGAINDSYKAKFVKEPAPMLSFCLTKNKHKVLLNKVINRLKKYLSQ